MFNLINDKKVSSEKYFIRDNRLLHKVVRESDKLFPVILVPIVHSKYILHHVYDALGHDSTVRMSEVTILLERIM